jgi:hypothetical protein
MLNGLHEIFAKMKEGTSRCLVAIRWSGPTPIVFGAHRSLANTVPMVLGAVHLCSTFPWQQQVLQLE